MSEQKKPPPDTKKEAKPDQPPRKELPDEELEKVAGGVLPVESSDPQEGGEVTRRR